MGFNGIYNEWPIEIDGLPINSIVIFHGYVTNNQMVYLYIYIYVYIYIYIWIWVIYNELTTTEPWKS